MIDVAHQLSQEQIAFLTSAKFPPPSAGEG